MTREELIKAYFSKQILMEVKNPMWEEFRAKSKMLHDQYLRDKEAEFPSWIHEKAALAMIKLKKE